MIDKANESVSEAEQEAQEFAFGPAEVFQKEDRRGTMTTRTYPVSNKRALEMAAWAGIVSGALKREANRAFWAGEVERASSFLPLIAHLSGKPKDVDRGCSYRRNEQLDFV